MAKAQTIQESRWVGRILRDKWRIDGRISRGGMGTVYAATHKNNGSVAAIKILHPEFSRDPDTRSRFLQEGYAANQVNHAGVVRILDDDVTEEGQAYLVMELLEGELLEQRRQRKGGKLPLPEVYELADQLLDVLAAAHAKEIVHRDIKPDNIFLTKEGRLKVLDFGFAQMKSGFRSERTATGFLLGTPGFMAPEQAIGNRPMIDAQTDIWAVGATMFLLLTGEPVHDGNSAAEMLIAAANYPARSVAMLEPGLPPSLVAVVDRALAFDKADRWPDARSMQMALRIVPGRTAATDPYAGRAQWGMSIPDDGRLQFDADEGTHEMSRDEVPRINSDITSEEDKTKAFVHPADADQETMIAPEARKNYSASSSPIADVVLGTQVPNEFGAPEPTMIMDGRPHQPLVLGAHPQIADLPPARPPMASYGQGFTPEPSAYAPPAVEAPRPPARSAASKALMLFLIGGVTMVIVILTGLIVILGSD